MLSRSIWALAALISLASSIPVPDPDPCVAIAGKRWVLPSETQKCFQSFPLEEAIKSNVIEVVTKTLAFHTSTNYQVQAPAPYDEDVHEDLLEDLQRINGTDYSSEFEFHLDIYRSFKRVNDGHCGVYTLFITYLPTPLVLLTDEDGVQSVHIAPEAHVVARDEFKDSVSFWEDRLPEVFERNVKALSGLKVILINGEDPFVAVEANAAITGGYQSHATRQNSFFSSYHRGPKGWEYSMGNFASLVHPLVDDVELMVEYPSVGGGNVTSRLPYRARFGSSSRNFTDGPSLREKNCLATARTNGIDLYDLPTSQLTDHLSQPSELSLFRQIPLMSPTNRVLERRLEQQRRMNVHLDGLPLSDISLPEHLESSLKSLNESYGVAQFYMLKDEKKGGVGTGKLCCDEFYEVWGGAVGGLGRVEGEGG